MTESTDIAPRCQHNPEEQGMSIAGAVERWHCKLPEGHPGGVDSHIYRPASATGLELE